MLIYESNGEIINSRDIYIHDDVFKQMVFEHSNKELKVVIRKPENMQVEQKISFVNVVGFEMTSCDFWGKSSHILDFEYVPQDKRTLLPKLHSLNKNCSSNKSLCILTNGVDYIETIITFVSGDKLTVACEFIEIEQSGQ